MRAIGVESFQVHAEIVEQLLFEDEGVSVDFKAQAYPFKLASEDQKSELLKDILAFANAFRRTDAYILVGVEHVKGGRNKVVGVAPDVDDAAVQQFVNSKTNIPVEFSLVYVPLEQKVIGLLHVPLQQRPIYLKKGYGKLKAKTIYLRLVPRQISRQSKR